jgi:tetratricopeptide (TPR) repeat protein
MAHPSESTGGLKLAGLRELLLPFGVGAAFVLHYVLHLPAWVVGVSLVPLLALFVWAPSWATRSTQAFDRDVVALLARRRPERLAGRYEQALGMRLFAPPAVSAERRALVAAESGQARAAYHAYRVALVEYGNAAPLRVLLGYGHAAFQTGDDAEAVRIYRQLADGHGSLPGVEINLAHALVRSGEAPRDALPLLERALAAQPAPALRARLLLIRAIAHAKLGEAAAAREVLRQAEPLGVDEHHELREQLDVALDARTAPHA